MNVEVREATEYEVGAAHHIMLEAFEEYRYLNVPSSAINESLTYVLNQYRMGKEKVLLCLVHGTPLGSLRFSINENGLYFLRVSVPPYARGRGLAKTMLAWLENYAISTNLSKLECRVRMSLPQNIHLYQSLGYRAVKEETVTNPNGFDVKTVVMEKRLSY